MDSLVVLLFFLLFYNIQMYQIGEEVEFHLKTSESLEVELQLQGPSVGLYVRPSQSNVQLEDQIAKKHKKKPKNNEEEPDDRRLLVNVQSPGQVEFSYQADQITVEDFYRSAVFRGVPKGKINVLVRCKQGPCQGTFTAYNLDDDQSFESDIELTQKLPLKAISLQIAAESDWDRLILILKTQGQLIQESKVALEIVGQSQIESHSTFESVYLVAKKSDIKSEDEIYVVVSASNLHTKTSMKVSYQFLQQETFLMQDESEILDFIDGFSNYRIKLSRKYESYGLSVTSLSEDISAPNIFANLDERPDNQKGYKFDSGLTQGKETTMLFRNQELDGTQLYVQLQSAKPVLVILRFIRSKNDPVLLLDDVFISQMIPLGVHNYMVRAFPLDQENGQYIRIQSQELNSTEQLKIYAKQCSKPECSDDAFPQEPKNIEQPQNSYISIGNKDLKAFAEIRPQCPQISQDTDGFCWYSIAVVSNSNQELKYQIYSKYSQGSIVLKINQAFSAEIFEGETHQMVLFYEPNDDDLSLTFTVSNQNVAYMIGVSSKCKPVTEECAIYFGSFQNPLTLRGDQLNAGAYHIAVFGMESTQYCISADVKKNSSSQAITLREGISHRGILYPGKENGDIAYFQFSVNFNQFQEDDLPSIELNLVGSHFKMGVVLNKGETYPSLNGFDLISLQGYISINPQSNLYQQQGVYSAAVQFLFHDSQEDISESTQVPYTITYATSNTLRHLPMNHIIHDTLLGGHNKTYFFVFDLVSMINNTIYLTKSHESVGAQLLFKLSSEPDDTGYVTEALHMKQGSSTFEIIGDELKKLCGFNEVVQEQTLCEIFIFVENQDELSAQYALTLWQSGVPIDLNEGVVQSYNIESIEKSQGILFSYTPVSYTHDMQILIQSYFGELSYNIKIFKRLDTLEYDQVQVYSSLGEHNSHSKTLSPSIFDKCKPNCQVQIQVFSNKDITNSYYSSEINSQREIVFDDIFTIIVSQKFMQLELSKLIEFSVSSGQPRYFIFNDLNTFISANRSLVLNMQELVGRAALCISVSDDEYLRMPFFDSKSSCDQHVIGNQIQLTSAQLKNLVKNFDLKNNLILIIEVSSYSESLITNQKNAAKIELILEDSQQSSKQILLSNPTRIQMGEQQQSTLQYFHYLQEDVEIKLTRLSGYGYFKIVVEKDGELNTLAQEVFLAGQSSMNTIISTKNKNFCSLCTYKLLFRTEQFISMLAIITVTTPNSFIKLSQGIAFVDSLNFMDKYNLYRVPVDVQKQTEITIHLYNGQPILYIGFNKSNEVQDYLFGPYDVQKYAQELALDNTPGFFETIIPPQIDLHLNKDKYQINLDSTEFAMNLVEEDLYILLISNSSTSNYSIIITQATNGAPSTLQDGVISSISLNRMKPTAKFLYYHLSDIPPLLIIRNTGPKKFNLLNELQFQLKLSEGNEHNSTNQSSMIDSQLKFFSYHTEEGQISYSFPQINGLFEVQIINKAAQENANNDKQNPMNFRKDGQISQVPFTFYDFHLNYLNRMDLQVSVTSQDTYLLPQNSWIHSSIKPDYANFYEISVPQDGPIGFQLQNCGSGQLTVSYTQSQKGFIHDKWDSQTKSINGISLDQQLNAKSGSLFISVHSNSDKEGTYILSTSNINPLPHGQLLLGGDGEVNFIIQEDDPDYIKVQFKPLRCYGCKEDILQSSQVIYELIWSKDQEYLNKLGKCGANQFDQMSKNEFENYGNKFIEPRSLTQEDESITQEIDVGLQSQHFTIWLSVRAIVTKYNNNYLQHYVMLYQNVQISLPKNMLFFFKHRRQEFAIGVSIFSLLVLLIIYSLCYIYSKINKLKKVTIELELEKKMSQAKQVRQEQYGQLQEEQAQEQDQNL